MLLYVVKISDAINLLLERMGPVVLRDPVAKFVLTDVEFVIMKSLIRLFTIFKNGTDYLMTNSEPSAHLIIFLLKEMENK